MTRPAGVFTTGAGCWAYTTALSVAATTDLLEDGSPGAPAANDVVVTLFTKD